MDFCRDHYDSKYIYFVMWSMLARSHPSISPTLRLCDRHVLPNTKFHRLSEKFSGVVNLSCLFSAFVSYSFEIQLDVASHSIVICVYICCLSMLSQYVKPICIHVTHLFWLETRRQMCFYNCIFSGLSVGIVSFGFFDVGRFSSFFSNPMLRETVRVREASVFIVSKTN